MIASVLQELLHFLVQVQRRVGVVDYYRLRVDVDRLRAVQYLLEHVHVVHVLVPVGNQDLQLLVLLYALNQIR